MPEFIVIGQPRDAKVGDTWFASGAFGLAIGSTLNMPGPCPICGAIAQTCIGDAHGNVAQAAVEDDHLEAAA